MSSEFYTLRRLGFTNQDTVDLSDLASEAYKKAYPYCTSKDCTGSYTGTKRVRKFVERSISVCPDCGDYLLWGDFRIRVRNKK
jgi:hypothetical protein